MRRLNMEMLEQVDAFLLIMCHLGDARSKVFQQSLKNIIVISTTDINNNKNIFIVCL